MTLIALLVESYKEGLVLRKALVRSGWFSLKELAIIIPYQTHVGDRLKFHGILDPHNLTFKVEYKDWIVQEIHSKIY